MTERQLIAEIAEARAEIEQIRVQIARTRNEHHEAVIHWEDIIHQLRST